MNHIQKRTHTHNFTIIQRLEPDLHHRRIRCRRLAADPARGTDRQRCDAGQRGRRVRPTLTRNHRLSTSTPHTVITHRARASTIAIQGQHTALRIPFAHRACACACAGANHHSGSTLLHDQNQRASGHFNNTKTGRLRAGMRLAWRSAPYISSIAQTITTARAIHAELCAQGRIRSGLRAEHDHHRR